MPEAAETRYKNRILASLPQPDLDRIVAYLHPVSLSLRQTLYSVGGVLESIYFIEEGIASILTTMASGDTIEVGMIGTEGLVGLPVLLGGEISDQQIIVQVPGSAVRIEAALYKAAFDDSAAVRRLTLRFAQGLLVMGSQTSACNRLHSTEQRFARWLLMAYCRLDAEVVPMTHEFLASMLGVRRTGVSETAAKLRRLGVIHYRQSEITLLDRKALETAACECYQADRRALSRLM
jgi:CRP-like cAMP-binding protein